MIQNKYKNIIIKNKLRVIQNQKKFFKIGRPYCKTESTNKNIYHKKTEEGGEGSEVEGNRGREGPGWQITRRG